MIPERYIMHPYGVDAAVFDGANGREIVAWINRHPRATAHLILPTAFENPDGTPANADATITTPDGQRIHPPAITIDTPWGNWIAERGDAVVHEEGFFRTYEPDTFAENFSPEKALPHVDCQTITSPVGDSAEGTEPTRGTSWEQLRVGFDFTDEEEAEIARIRAEQLAAVENYDEQ